MPSIANNSLDILSTALGSFSQEHGIGLVIGENVDVGSHISGLSLFLKRKSSKPEYNICNTPNCESITAGISIDYSWRTEKASCLFVKQFDFMTLYLDDLIHTVNLYSGLGRKINLNIITYAVDVGLEGYQSGLDRLYTLSRLLRVEPLFVTLYSSTQRIQNHLVKSGVKLFILSQRYARGSLNSQLLDEQRYTNNVDPNDKINILMDFSCYTVRPNQDIACWEYVSSESELISLLERLRSTNVLIHSTYQEIDEVITRSTIKKIAEPNELVIEVRTQHDHRYEHGINR